MLSSARHGVLSAEHGMFGRRGISVVSETAITAGQPDFQLCHHVTDTTSSSAEEYLAADWSRSRQGSLYRLQCDAFITSNTRRRQLTKAAVAAANFYPARKQLP